MNEIMPVLSDEQINELKYVQLIGTLGLLNAQRDADRKAIFLKLASYPRHYEAGIRYLHMPVEDWEEFKKECFTLKEVADG